MFRHACVVTLVLLVTLNIGGITTDKAEATEHGWHNREALRFFEFSPIWAQTEVFRLEYIAEDPKGGDEAFDRYFLALHTTFGLEEGVSFASFEIKRQSTQDVICSGTVANVEGFNKYQYCDEIKPGHFYQIEYTTAIDAELVLYGVNPIAPVQPGDVPFLP